MENEQRPYSAILALTTLVLVMILISSTALASPVENSLPARPYAFFSTNATSGFVPLSVQFNDSSQNATAWSWNFGEGSNSTEQNPEHTYSEVGNYTVNLTVTNENGTNSTFANITVLEQPKAALPVANFSDNVSKGYAPLSVQFTDLSKNAIGWDWNFGDGANSTMQNPVHTYSTAGNYTVTLTISNVNGTDAKSSYVIVSKSGSAPVAAFSASPTSGSVPLNVSFTDESAGSPTSWKWYFGDSTNSTDQNPVHTFSKPGIYTVSLTASNAGGSSSVAKSSYITVSNGVTTPIAAFSASPTSGSVPLNVSFTDESTGSPTSWKWYFGDSTNSTDQNPVHTFSKPGIYTVSLTASNAGGSNSVVKSGYITVSNSVTTPIAAFSASPTSGSVPLNVSFTDESTGSPTSWKWYFGDSTNSTDQNPVHTFSKPGIYTVSLTASNAGGSNSVVKSGYITVSNSVTTPIAAFSASPTSGSVPLNVSFTDESTGSPTSWKWYFGDSTNSTDQNPVHTFSKPGIYTVSLMASNAGGSNSVVKSGYITVSNSVTTPIAAFSASPTSGSVPLNVSFTDESTGSPTSWKWYFGDGTSSTDQNPVHTFSKPGIYTVSLTASNAISSSSVTKSSFIYVPNSLDTPVAAFSASPTSGSAPLRVQFNASSTGSPTSWQWFFGEYATNTTDQNPVHTYYSPGLYTVTLTTRNAGGSTAVTKRNYIYVTKDVSAPVTAFSASPTSGSSPLNVSFIDESTNSPTLWQWYFGDSTNSTDQNPVHTFSKPGIYTVSLTASNAGGSSSVTKSSYITISNGVTAPAAAFSASPTSGSSPLNVSFTDDSTGSPTAWQWYFGDGANSTDQNPVHTFSKPGIYTVSLTASNAGGSNSVVKSGYITVSNSVISPIAAFSASPTSGSSPLNVSFTDKSTGSPTSWQWYFGDSTNSTDQNPVHTFSKPGIYTVTLTASNAGGSSSVTKSSYITISNGVTAPAAAFSASPLSGSSPLNVSFTDQSTGSPTSWQWYFGDSTNSTDQNPVHTFSKPGIYTVSLTASNAGGSNSVVKSGYITISSSVTAPAAAFSVSPTSGSSPLNVSFTDKSTGSPTSWQWYFGDSANSTDQNPVHTFSKPGIYTVSLMASNAGGSNSVVKSGYITVSNSVTSPIAAFSASPTSGSSPLNVSFTDESTGSPTSWQWYFGDGTSSIDQNPVHTFSKAGTYTISLTITNPGGSSSIVISRHITVK